MTKTSKIICIIFSLGALIGGAIYTCHVRDGYAKGRKEYAFLTEEYTSLLGQTETAGDGEEISFYGAENEPAQKLQEGTRMEEKNIWKVLVAELPSDAPERLIIDWKGLLDKNEDTVGWINIPSVQISYPIVQSDDNEYYLHRGIDGKYLFAGCIFMDTDNSPSLMGYNTIIYGHNMRDGSMFARLKEFQNEETLQNSRYFWLQTPSSDNLYEISSIHKATPGSETYMLRFAGHEDHYNWLKEMSSLSSPATGVTLSSGDRIVTLSTCTSDSISRLVVQGKLIYRRETGDI